MNPNSPYAPGGAMYNSLGLQSPAYMQYRQQFMQNNPGYGQTGYNGPNMLTFGGWTDQNNQNNMWTGPGSSSWNNQPGGMGGGGLGGGTTGAESLPINNQRMAINQQNWDRRDAFMRQNRQLDFQRQNPGDLPTVNSSLLSGNMNDYWRGNRPTHGRSGGGFGPNIPGWVRGF